MQATDKCAELLGIECLSIGEDSAVVCMRISGDMLNMHGSGHAGMIFTLADTAFAFACNSEDRAAVAQGVNIEFLGQVCEGDKLTATARSQLQKKRTGIYDIEVKNQSDALVALFTGKAFTIDTPGT